MTLIGQLDQYDSLNRSVRGWAALQGDELASCTVVALSQGEVVAEVSADIYREDLELGGVGHGRFAFELTLPELPVGARVSVQEKATGLVLTNGEFAIAAAQDCLQFHLDSVTDSHISGWIVHTGRDTPVLVEFRVRAFSGGDDVVVAQGVAENVRPDIEGGRACGFALETNLNTYKAFPARLVMLVEGVEIADCHILLPMGTETVASQLEERLESLMGLTIMRMDQDIQRLRQDLEVAIRDVFSQEK